MQTFWRQLYSSFIIPSLWLLIRFIGIFKKKIKRGIKGREHLFASLEQQVALLGSRERIWFHASSMGEFEQAKPIIAELKNRYPRTAVIASFFSPSGYEHSKKYHLADVITYLPFDTMRNAARFVEIVRPLAAVMVRYDVWPNHIWELQDHGIPTLIANATMRERTLRRLPIVRNFHHYVYQSIDRILTVSQQDVHAFRHFALTRPSLEAIGDTRYDQVLERSTESKKRRLIPEAILEAKLVLVAGSTWPEDEEILLPVILSSQKAVPNFLSIIVPHEPTVGHLEQLEDALGSHTKPIRFSALNEYRGEQVIIVDSVGMLMNLYTYAHVAYVGGSFKQGIHNVLEAAVYGIPVIFGPRHKNSQEPLILVEQGGGFVVNNEHEMRRTLLNLIENETARRAAGAKAERFVKNHAGATKRFIHHLESYMATEGEPQ